MGQSHEIRDSADRYTDTVCLVEPPAQQCRRADLFGHSEYELQKRGNVTMCVDLGVALTAAGIEEHADARRIRAHAADSGALARRAEGRSAVLE